MLVKQHVEAVTQQIAGGWQDDGAGQQIGQAQLALAGQWVLGAHDQTYRFNGNLLEHELPVVVLCRKAGHQDVELALLHPWQQQVADRQIHPYLHPRKLLVHARNGLRHQNRTRAGHHAQVHQPGQALLQGIDFFFGLAQVGQHHAGVANHDFAVRRGFHAARQAVEQRHAQRFFDFFQQLRGGGLRHGHGGRCPVDVAFFVQAGQQQQLARLQPRSDEPVGMLGLTAAHVGPGLTGMKDVEMRIVISESIIG